MGEWVIHINPLTIEDHNLLFNRYLLERQDVMEKSKKYKSKLKKFRNLMNYLQRKTKKEISLSNDMYFLYQTLKAEAAAGRNIPKWINKKNKHNQIEQIFPSGELLDGANLEYKLFSYNEKMKKLNRGMLVKKIVDNMVARSKGKLDQRRKLMLYSGHETNVAAVLQALGVYKPHVPQFSSAVIIELHKDKGKPHYVKVCYK